MTANKISSELLILDFEDANAITRYLDINPSQVINKGDVKRVDPKGVGPDILEKRSVWVWGSGFSKDEDAEDHLTFILGKLKDKQSELKELSTKYTIEISIYGHTYRSEVGIHIEKEQLQQLANMGAEIDIDIYSLEDR